MSLTLGQLINHHEFGLELSSGGEAALDLPVDGAHCIDHESAARWLQERWIMMATGAHWLRSPGVQKELVNQLIEENVTALGLGLGLVLDEVPEPLLAEAERKNFPVFTVPWETPFREIVLYVTRSTLSADLHALQRLNGMQRYLLDALHETSPESTLVERLGSLLDEAEVCYFDRNGNPLAATTPGVEWPQSLIEDGSSAIQEFELEGRPGFVATVLKGNRVTGWLSVRLRPMTISPQVARPVVRTASELLGLVSVARQGASRDRDSHRQRLGARLLRALSGEGDRGLASHLAEEGIDFVTPCRAVAVATRSGEPSLGVPPTPEAVAALAELVDGFGIDAVLGKAEAEVGILMQDDFGRVESALAEDPRLDSLCFGISEPLSRFDDLGLGFDQARLALGVALSDRSIVSQRHEELDPSATLIASGASPEMVDRLEKVLEPLDEEPRLRDAVVAYLDSGFDLGRTAGALHLHRNSVRHRLTRAEEALGRSLRSPETVTAIHLALLAQSWRRSPEGNTFRAVPANELGQGRSERLTARITSAQSPAA